MGEWTTEKFDGARIDESTNDCGTAVTPLRFESVQRRCGSAMFANRQRPIGRLVGAQLPITEPVVHSGEAVRIVELRSEHRCDAQ